MLHGENDASLNDVNSTSVHYAAFFGNADIMKKLGFEDTVMASSSMDYAKESGFRSDDGAKILYKNALSLI